LHVAVIACNIPCAPNYHDRWAVASRRVLASASKLS